MIHFTKRLSLNRSITVLYKKKMRKKFVGIVVVIAIMLGVCACGATTAVDYVDAWVGEHLNFVSSSNPDVKIGDIVTVKVEKVSSTLGSWFITYKKIK